MTKTLRLIGYWDGPAAPGGWPDARQFVDPQADPRVQSTVAAYLRSGTTYLAAAGVSICRLCGASNGSAELTDGTHFVWPSGLAHYVEAHSVRLPKEFVAVAIGGTAPVVDLAEFEQEFFETGSITIDSDWWRHVTRN